MGKDRDPRYEKEIKELLNGLPEFISDEESRQPLPFRPRGTAHPTSHRPRRSFPALWGLSRVQVLVLAAFACLVGSFIVRYFSPAIASYLGLAAGLLFIVALIVAVLSNRGPQREMRWRGRTITYSPTAPGWQIALQQQWWRIKARFRRRRR